MSSGRESEDVSRASGPAPRWRLYLAIALLIVAILMVLAALLLTAPTPP